jgi:hypothetical protein|tara:strand:+ start:677 stop:1507 length:831 start_codon:yes stop_codon:yes gene_type:complete
MPWIDDPHPESDHPDRYWLPDVIPEKNETLEQTSKKYLKPDGGVIPHPRWVFDGGAYVTDEYLYRNVGYLQIVQTEFTPLNEGAKISVQMNPPAEWHVRAGEEFNIYATYTVIETIDSKPQDYDLDQYICRKVGETSEKLDDRTLIKVEYKLKKIVKNAPIPKLVLGQKHQETYMENPIDEWDETEDEIHVTYSKVDNGPVSEFEQRQVVIADRNELLRYTDFAFILAIEKGWEVSDELKSYRQELRDLPSKLTDIYNVEWPKEPHYPTEYFKKES